MDNRELDNFGTSEDTVIDTGVDLKDGQNKCEKCGSTEISVNKNNGNLRCHFCRHEQEPTKVEKFVTDISQLEGQVIGSGAEDIVADVKDQLTFKCGSCASEVVIDTSEAQQARCHWCRQTLSVNQQIPNGAVPDKVLPFSVKREDAIAAIEKFVGNRKFLANKTFKAEFQPENVMGVYLPYMVIDVNSHAKFVGEASHTVRTYTETNGNVERTLKDVDVYRIERDFDLIVEDLTVEANAEKLKHRSSERTNNIVNAIKPFDVEKSVAWNANYMTGFTSQKRDVNASELSGLVQEKAEDIATNSVMNDTMTSKSQGVKWSRKNMTFKGKQWRSAYLPVWIYSYQQEKSNDKRQIHYVAVNGRTQKAMGSVPMDTTKLIAFSLLLALLFILPGLIFFFVMKSRYRNASVSHDFARETTRRMNNLISNDTLIRQDRGILVSERRLDDESQQNSNRNAGRSAAVAVAAASQTGRNANTSNKVAAKKSSTKAKTESKVSVSTTKNPSEVKSNMKATTPRSDATSSTPNRSTSNATSRTRPNTSNTSSKSSKTVSQTRTTTSTLTSSGTNRPMTQTSSSSRTSISSSSSSGSSRPTTQTSSSSRASTPNRSSSNSSRSTTTRSSSTSGSSRTTTTRSSTSSGSKSTITRSSSTTSTRKK